MLLDKTPMNQILTLEVSEQVFIAIQRQAAKVGIAPERLAATLIEQRLTSIDSVQDDATEAEAARKKFESHFGALDSETPISIDNQAIDSDLAREYASNHE